MDAKYLDEITAIGYGETTFAAFYPNCRSVFGFYDSREAGFTLEQGLEYDVIGWYSNPDQDYLSKLVEQFQHTYKQNTKQEEQQQINQYIQEKLQWDVINLDLLDKLPQFVCYALLLFIIDSKYLKY